MPRFFTNHANENEIILRGEDARHIGLSLRMRTGEMVTVCCDGMDYVCEITGITETEVFLHPVEISRCDAEPDVHVTLYQAMPKQDKLAEIVQKSIELGVSEIVPVMTSRCVVRISPADFIKKQQRLQKIALAAAKQSGRGKIPQVRPLLPWQAALEDMRRHDLSFMLYEEKTEEGKHFHEILHASGYDGQDYPVPGTISLFVGSEGGISPEEAEAAIQAGCHPVWLGRRILRCETAPVAALAILMYLTHNLE